MQTAMKAREQLKVDTLRMVMAAITKASVDRKKDLTEEEELAVLQREVKARRDSAEQYRAAGREEQAAKEEAEIAIIQAYMPEAIEGEALIEIVENAIAQTGASSPSDTGKVMGAIMREYRGRVDGKEVQRCVSERLQG